MGLGECAKAFRISLIFFRLSRVIFRINSETVAHDDLRIEGFKGSDLAVEHCILIFSGQLG